MEVQNHGYSVIDVGSSILQRLTQPCDKKKIKLDFMSSVLRVAAISFYKLKTLIGVEQYRIVIQPPSPYQGAVRCVNSQNRNDVCELTQAICTALICYPPKNEALKKIYQVCRNGLQALGNSYTSEISEAAQKIKNPIYISLQQCMGYIDQQIAIYDTKLQQKIAPPSIESNCPQAAMNKMNHLQHVATPIKIDDYLYAEKLRNAVLQAGYWKEDDFTSTACLFKRAEEAAEVSEKTGYVNAILQIVAGKDPIFAKIAQQYEKENG